MCPQRPITEAPSPYRPDRPVDRQPSSHDILRGDTARALKSSVAFAHQTAHRKREKRGTTTMKYAALALLTACLVRPLVLAQSRPDDATVAFDVVSIKPHKVVERGARIGFEPGGRFVLTNATIAGLVLTAYPTPTGDSSVHQTGSGRNGSISRRAPGSSRPRISSKYSCAACLPIDSSSSRTTSLRRSRSTTSSSRGLMAVLVRGCGGSMSTVRRTSRLRIRDRRRQRGRRCRRAPTG